MRLKNVMIVSLLVLVSVSCASNQPASCPKPKLPVELKKDSPSLLPTLSEIFPTLNSN